MNNKLSQISILGLGLITYSFFACNQTVTPAAQDEITFQCDSLTKDLETLNNVTGIVKSAKLYKEYITVGEPKVIYVIELQKGGEYPYQNTIVPSKGISKDLQVEGTEVVVNGIKKECILANNPSPNMEITSEGFELLKIGYKFELTTIAKK